MKYNQTTDFFYQLFTLIAATIIVHAAYIAVIPAERGSHPGGTANPATGR